MRIREENTDYEMFVSFLSQQLRMITHDTRNALAAIRATAQLGVFLAKEDPQYKGLFQEIIHNVDRANGELQHLVAIRAKLMEKVAQDSD